MTIISIPELHKEIVFLCILNILPIVPTEPSCHYFSNDSDKGKTLFISTAVSLKCLIVAINDLLTSVPVLWMHIISLAP